MADNSENPFFFQKDYIRSFPAHLLSSPRAFPRGKMTPSVLLLLCATVEHAGSSYIGFLSEHKVATAGNNTREHTGKYF